MTVTVYQSSKGPIEIATMPYSHLANAINKMEREDRTADPVFAALVSRKMVMDAEGQPAADAPKSEPAPREAVIGDNGAPEATTFDAIKEEIEDLRIEAGAWLDGQVIENQQQADELGRLLDLVRKASKRADDARKAEKKVFDDGAAEVQERYNTLIGDTKKVKGTAVLIEETAKNALAKWLSKVKADQDAERERAAQEAREKQERAEMAVACTHASDDIEERADALAMAETARQAQAQASVANKAKAQVQTGGRAIGLVTTYEPEVSNLQAALIHYWKERPLDFTDLVMQFAREDVRAGKRTIPGILVNSVETVR